MPRIALIAALALLVFPAGAQALDFGNWRVTATGSVTHKWKLSGSGPCATFGSGKVTAAAHGRSKRFRIQYFANDGFRQWDIPGKPFRARGKARRTDAAKQRAAQDGESCKPRPRNGCGDREALSRRTFGSVEGMVPQRKARVTFSYYSLMDTFPERSRCYTGGFTDFNAFPGAPFANYGRMVGNMPSPARVAQRRAFTVRFADRRTKKRGDRRTTTVRRVKLRFKPV